MALKPCQGCGKQLDTSAKACPHCGRPSPTATAGSKVLGGLVALAVVGIGVRACAEAGSGGHSAGSSRAQTAAVAATAAPAMAVDAVTLWKAYQANEVAADDVYKGRRLAVTGRVQSIDKDFMDHIVIKLASPNEFMGVHATMQASEKRASAALHRGDSFSALCTGKGMVVGSPMLDDCAFSDR